MRFIPFGFMRGDLNTVPSGPCFTKAFADGGTDPNVDTLVKYDSINNNIVTYGDFTGMFNTSYIFPYSYNGKNLGQLTYDGIVNTGLTIGSGFNQTTYTLDFQSTGKLILGGSFTTYSGISTNRIIRLNSNYTKDTSFTMGTGFNGGVVEQVKVQSDNKILVFGSFTQYSGITVSPITRLNSDGTLDTAFNSNVISASLTYNTPGPFPINNIVIQSDGKILVGGVTYSTALGLVRLNSDGTVDTTFSSNMGTGFNSTVKNLCLQSDGKIICTGYFGTFNSVSKTAILRLNSSGTLDTSFSVNFDPSTFYMFSAYVQQVPSSGKIMAGGDSSYGLPNFYRLNTNGTIDNTFTYSSVFTNESIKSFEILSNEKILFSNYGGGVPNIGRMNSNGSSDLC